MIFIWAPKYEPCYKWSVFLGFIVSDNLSKTLWLPCGIAGLAGGLVVAIVFTVYFAWKWKQGNHNNSPLGFAHFLMLCYHQMSMMFIGKENNKKHSVHC